MRAFCTFVLSLLALASALAHPVTQGRLQLEVRPGHIVLQMQVSAEEVLIAGTLADRSKPAATLQSYWQNHGAYLLAHVRVIADEARLAGRVTSFAPPTEVAGDPGAGFARYELEFALNADQPRPLRIRLEQDVLNEIMFAPGNPWTSSYIARLSIPGEPPRDGVLFAHTQPLVLEPHWDAAPAPDSAAPEVAQVENARVWREFLAHGFRHILEGWDHLLFVSALALAAVTLWDLFKVVGMFTLAHTITLVLSVLNIVRLPERVVEPVIALSIVVVALQNVLAPRQARGALRLAAAFAFGLFHGLGFAGGLLEAMAGLPGVALASAIAAFSIGVEGGHLCVVLPVFLVALFVRRVGAERGRLLALRLGSCAIALAGCWYLVAALRMSAR